VASGSCLCEQLAAGIAHEINTPTQFIGDNIRFLQQSVVLRRPAIPWCGEMQLEATFVGRLRAVLAGTGAELTGDN
jgi:hypothetical protein